MAEYLTPGVYVEEYFGPRYGSGYGDARAVAAFVGLADKGPAEPTLITSWNQFERIFGGFAGPRNYLPYAVHTYFRNGGARCYIVRAVRADAVPAETTVTDNTPADQGGPQPAVRFVAQAPGSLGNKLSIRITPTGASGRFNVFILEDGVEVERFEDLSADPNDGRYMESIIDSPATGSRLVRMYNLKVENPEYTYNPDTDYLPAQTAVFSGGEDGEGPYDFVAAAKKLADLDVNIDLNLPGETSIQILNEVIAWAEETKKVFVVVDGPRAAENATSGQVLTGYTAMVSGATPLLASSFAAIYGPWIMISDPSSRMYGAVRMIPPGGAVLAKFARNDAVRHVGKTPAGVETVLDGVVAAETRFSQAELDEAAENHINIIRNVPGYGICIMGGRTLHRELPMRYISARRTVIYLRKQLSDLTRFAVFEPNGPDLWQEITLRVSQYLGTLARAGVLGGTNEAEAFSVKCDADINPPSEVAAGRVNVEVMVALRYPAEFVVIRLGQTDQGTEITEFVRR